ncbi:MAG: hypothetical protein ACRYGI_11505 [Janthinobacterium lividum]
MNLHDPHLHSATERFLIDMNRAATLMTADDDELPEYQEHETMNMEAIEAYWRDPSTFIAERARRFAEFDAAMAPHDARVRAKQEARWAQEGQS